MRLQSQKDKMVQNLVDEFAVRDPKDDIAAAAAAALDVNDDLAVRDPKDDIAAAAADAQVIDDLAARDPKDDIAAAAAAIGTVSS